jgi:two-component system nitrate/nitrite response regulator NarL
MSDCVRVVVIDDHALFRSGVIQGLHMDDNIRVVAEGSTANDAVQLVEAHRPDVMLLDITMPGGGIEAAEKIAHLAPETLVVMLTVSESDDHISRSLRAGAMGYVLKGVGADQLIDVVKGVARGTPFISPNLAFRLVSMQAKVQDEPIATLSKQEEKILRHVTAGKSNRQIGEELNILTKTVKFHMTRIMRKLNVKNRMEAALIARDHWY